MDANTTAPGALYVEGIAASNSVRDAWLKLSFPVGGQTFEDLVKVTVFDCKILKCDSAFMPKGGDEHNTTAITATIVPFGLFVPGKFTLFDVSDEPGYCLNKPDPLPLSGRDSDSWKDLQFAYPQTGWTISGDDYQYAVHPATDFIFRIDVNCTDYGAYGKIKAEMQVNGTWYTAHVDGGTDPFVRIPRDDNPNDLKYISIAWPYHSYGAYDACDIDASYNDPNYRGDGLTMYEEYRGVDIDGDGKVDMSERLNPLIKDLFVTSKGFGGEFPDFAYGNAFANVNIAVHLMPYQDHYRKIEVVVVEATDANDPQWTNHGHIINQGVYSGSRWWTFDGVGNSSVGDDWAFYGSPTIWKQGVNYWFGDKPYVDGNTWTAPGVWGGSPNGVLDPLNKVEDSDDNGVLDWNEKDGNVTPPYDDGDNNFDGDYPVKSGSTWEYNRALNPCDIDNDGLIELDGTEWSKAQQVKATVTHEMGHAVGISRYDVNPEHGNCTNQSCIMSGNADPDAIFCDICASRIKIHNRSHYP